ncbi:hypothetical protein SPRG_07090 [Saprolegnia parasitica CBS 223.65]|uniref:MSP domain-containing protein n=1 Tax=Saprolegnia parasitica (strain CBS 223.65) TaxID=695850 RepID=A0A067CLR9_SAPPC|nr:hypothetical protein SPRG_07090 [Saprolegnia parasitica CBS 223.65]KDO27501.1 hypothetical protein SPRG_07090 [Saprolegnia parasitica CBS 223.65]|eukprot:XP_012201933.1 hypothetical protein SPRG_07090 [Saprolegnia parasitica CBS 223.65]
MMEPTMQDYLKRYDEQQKARAEAGRRDMDLGDEDHAKNGGPSKYTDMFFGSDSDGELSQSNLLGEMSRDFMASTDGKNMMDDTNFMSSLLGSPVTTKPSPLMDPPALPTKEQRDSLESLFAPQTNLASQANHINFDKDPINLDTESFVDAATFLNRQEALMKPQTTRPEAGSDNTTWTSSGFRSPDDFFAERSRDLSNVEFGDTAIPRKSSLSGLPDATTAAPQHTKEALSYMDFSAPPTSTTHKVFLTATPSSVLQHEKPPVTTTTYSRSSFSTQPTTPSAKHIVQPTHSTPRPQQVSSPMYRGSSWTPTPSTDMSQPSVGLSAPFMDLSISQSTPVKDLVPRRQTPPVETQQPLSISTYLQNSLANYANRPNVSSVPVNIDDEPFKVVSDAVQAAMSLTAKEREAAQWHEPIHPSHVIHSSLDAVAAVQAMIEATGHMQASVSEVMRLRAHAKQAIEAAVVSEAMAIADYQKQRWSEPPRLRAGSQQFERRAIDNITAELTSVVQEPTQPVLPPPRRSSRASIISSQSSRAVTGGKAQRTLDMSQRQERAPPAHRDVPFSAKQAASRTDNVIAKCAEPTHNPDGLSPSSMRARDSKLTREFGLSPIRFEPSSMSVDEPMTPRPTSDHDVDPADRTMSEADRRQMHALLATKSPIEGAGRGHQSTATPMRSYKRDSTLRASHSVPQDAAKPNLRIDTSVARAAFPEKSKSDKPPSTKMHRDDLRTAFTDLQHHEASTPSERYSIQQHAGDKNTMMNDAQTDELAYKEVPMSPPPTPYTKALERPKLCKRFLCTLGGEISETFVFRNTSATYARICASIVPLSRGCNQFRIVPTVLEMPPHASDHFVIRFVATQVGAVSGIFQFRSMSGDPRATPYEIIVDAHVKNPATPVRQPTPPRIVQEVADEDALEANGSTVDVHPTFLRLLAANDVKSFEVINFSDKDVPFSIACPYPHISLAPTQGVVGPKSKSTVTVHCNAATSSALPPNKKTWCGSFTITLNNALTREISVVVDASALAHEPPSYPKSSQLSQSSVASSTRTKKRSKRGLFFQAENMDCGSAALHTSQCVPVRICNGAKEPMTVFVQTLGRPFSCAYSSLTLRPRSYVEVPVVFTPEKLGDASVPMVVYSSTDKAILMLHGRATASA